jgi:RIO-like serine/threonine protein kinase
MSVDATCWAWDKKIKPEQKLVLLVLADYINDSGFSTVGLDFLQEHTGMTLKAIEKALSRLESESIIVRGEYSMPGRKERCSGYSLNGWIRP